MAAFRPRNAPPPKAAKRHGERGCEEACDQEPRGHRQVQTRSAGRQCARTAHPLAFSSAPAPPAGSRSIPVGAVQALYVLYRVVYLWATFSLWHMGGFALLLAVYGVVWFMLTKAAEPVCVRRPAPAQHPPSTAAQHRRPAQQHPVLPRESRAARAPGCTGCRREAKHNVPRACAAGTRLSRMAARSSAAATTSTRRPAHYGYTYYARRA